MKFMHLRQSETTRERHILQKLINKDVLDLLKDNAMFIAGGAVTSVFSRAHINDFDIYVRSREDLEIASKGLKEILDKPLVSTPAADSYVDDATEMKYQLIKHPSMLNIPVDIMTQFDFTICMGAYWAATDEIIVNSDFLRDLAARRLKYNVESKWPIASLFRLRKFLRRRFHISGTDVVKIALRVYSLNLNTWMDLRDQLMGIDTLFLRGLTDRLSSDEMAEKVYDFNEFLAMIDEYLEAQWAGHANVESRLDSFVGDDEEM